MCIRFFVESGSSNERRIAAQRKFLEFVVAQRAFLQFLSDFVERGPKSKSRTAAQPPFLKFTLYFYRKLLFE